jgi:hypothetical protein
MTAIYCLRGRSGNRHSRQPFVEIALSATNFVLPCYLPPPPKSGTINSNPTPFKTIGLLGGIKTSSFFEGTWTTIPWRKCLTSLAARENRDG